MFIQTEDTPNPSTLKFMPQQPVLASGTAEFRSEAAASTSPLARRIFEIGGIDSVFLATDFITVTKSTGEIWSTLRPLVLGAIMDHFTSGAPAVAEGTAGSSASGDAANDSPVITQIKDILDSRIRPAVAQDGGDITFDRFDDGVVYLHLRGACSGCPSATATLKSGVENMLKHYIPEVREVRQSAL
jgi:Fe-S cluster biogenesis protein NfuA